MVVGVYELARPDEFRATATISLHSDGSEIIQGDRANKYEAVFVTTREILQSDMILSNVVYRLEFREKWAEKHFKQAKIKTALAISRMRGRLDVSQVQNAKLVAIRFESVDAAEAALIANTVAEAYQDWRIEQACRLVQRDSAALQEELEITDQKINATKDAIDRLMKASGEDIASDSFKTNYRTFLNLRKNLEELNDLRRLITRKKNIGGVDSRIPFDLILERAVPSKTPVSYHWRRGRTLTVLGVALFACGLAAVLKSRPLDRHDSPA
jgi:hypothetical protein